ncbi:hypothetical protein GS462_11095 [Rhodococcus hoagii]|nr:hypothetical protein [Prescottella equi]MBM4650958.1 hypothetical protein [Prescottella equi]MBM4686695.1 hypothetical protein [Prescottella equi]
MTIYATPDRDGSTIHVIRRSGDLECVDCSIETDGYPEPITFGPASIPTMLDHLELHVALGDTVPQSAFDRLRHEHRDNREAGRR